MATDSPIQFKGVSLKVIQTQLRTVDVAELEAGLVALTGNQRDFFENEPAVLDFSGAEDLPTRVDWAALRSLLRAWGLQAVATRGLPEALALAAAEAGLAALAADALGRSTHKATPVSEAAVLAAAEEPPAPAPAVEPQRPAVEAPVPTASSPTADHAAERAVAAAPPSAQARLIDKPVRSGQRVYAQGGDLVVLAMVSAGAELIADGNIHVYAPLRGRALAGASGNKAARIFTTSMEAELVSVAGIYRTFEAGVPEALRRKPATISLQESGENPTLLVQPLQLQ